MARLVFFPNQGQGSGLLNNLAAFPRGIIGIGFPECLGPAKAPSWQGNFTANWTDLGEGVWRVEGATEGLLTYSITVRPAEEHCDFEFSLTNTSTEAWDQGMAFNCVQAGSLDKARDNECIRHWTGQQGQLVKLPALPRQYSPRPTVQLYSVEGQPPGAEIPFVANFQATPADLVVEPWLAIESQDGRCSVATVSKPALFLFQNMEYSCIHSGCGFGPMEPGATSQAVNRVFAVARPVKELYPLIQEFLSAG